MPICTVASRRDGSLLSSSAASAPRLPCAASGCNRAGRAETSAISAIAKKPLSRISSRTIDRCRVSIGSPAAPSPANAGRVPEGEARGRARRTMDPHPAAAGAARHPLPRRGRGSGTTSARIVFDDEVGLHRHRERHIGELRRAHETAVHAVVVDLDIVGHVALARLAASSTSAICLAFCLSSIVSPSRSW